MAKESWINIGGTWKKATTVFQKIEGIWKRITPKGNIEGNWKDLIEYALHLSLDYTFSESSSSSSSHTFTFPNLVSVDDITVDMGNVTYSISGDEVKVSVSGGNYTRRSSYTDSHKYSKSVTDYSTSSSDSFSSTKSYNSDGYSGTLSKDGSSFVSSGSYTPKKSKTITEYKVTKRVIDYYEYDGTRWNKVRSTNNTDMTTYYYNQDGYSGTLPLSRWDLSNYNTPSGEGEIGEERTHMYEAYGWYTGTVTKPASDTRVYRQNYSGYAYKSGTSYHYYYTYKININYTTKKK